MDALLLLLGLIGVALIHMVMIAAVALPLYGLIFKLISWGWL
jgi:hypothetical protein